MIGWQRQIRDRLAGTSGWWDGVNTQLSSAVVRECSRAQAKQVILQYEWLGTMPPSVWQTGIFFDGWACGGVVVFSVGAGVFMHKELGINRNELAYLARGACAHWTPKGSASKLIGHSLRLASRRGCKIALAYSDTDAGEIGTVYQATNWVCIGRGASTTQMIHPITGKVYDQKLSYNQAKRAVPPVARAEARRQLLDAGFTEQHSNPKWRYVYVLAKGAEGKRIRHHIESLVQPYPKRPKDSSEPAAIHVAEGGAAPTRTLQTTNV